MAKTVSTTVYKDRFSVYPEGSVQAIPANALIGVEGYVNISNTNDIRVDFSMPHKKLLQLNVDGYSIYVDETKESWTEKIYESAGGGGSNTTSGTFVVGTAGVVKVGNDVTIAALAEKTIIHLLADGLMIGHTLEVVDEAFTGKITFPGGIGAAAELFIIYNL